MNSSVEKIEHLLQGKWLMQNTEHEHYLIFKHGSYQSRHREGTYTIEQDEHGNFVMKMTEAHHPRTLQVIDSDTIVMSFSVHDHVIKNKYLRDRSLKAKLQVLKA